MSLVLEMGMQGLELPTEHYPEWREWYRENHMDMDEYVLFEHGQPIGFVAWRCYPDYVRLCTLYVNEAYRGEGYGRTLIDVVRGYMFKNEIDKPLRTKTRNLKAIPLLETLGVEVTDESYVKEIPVNHNPAGFRYHDPSSNYMNQSD